MADFVFFYIHVLNGILWVSAKQGIDCNWEISDSKLQQPQTFLLENLKEMVYVTWIKDEDSYTVLVCDYVLATQ